MCLINIAFNSSKNYPLILAANRDEFYSRPTQALHWWPNSMIAGKDLQDGGAWMGMSADGKLAALTNYRDPKLIKKNVPSRGELVTMYLGGLLSIAEFHAYLKTNGALYNGFNLIYGDSQQLFYYANTTKVWRQLPAGIYGLTNAFLDTPWPKLVKSKQQFTTIVKQDLPDFNKILQLFYQKELEEDHLLPSTGVPLQLERQLSALFIETPNYGTRLTSLITIDQKNHVVFREKSFIPTNDVTFQFNLP